MNAVWLLLPIIFFRYFLLGLMDKAALKRAAFFPPLEGKEKIAYWFYQISTVLLFLYSFFIKVTITLPFVFVGLAVYFLGIIVCVFSTLNFVQTDQGGPALKGLYGISRNPMYIGYFLTFLGCALLTQSFIFLAILIIFQISAHWIILSEERWCIKKFGKEYVIYMGKVRRYM